MIILDTNVISEPMKAEPDPKVLDWLNRQDPTSVWLSIITVAELRYGVENRPSGRKQDVLREAVENYVTRIFVGRIAPFDDIATEVFGQRLAAAKRGGREIKGFADAAIAATAISRGFMVATRDAAPFEAMGVRILNPWVDATDPV